MNFVLRMFAIETLIRFVIEFLISTVKNPFSDRAQKLRYVLTELAEVIKEFLDRTNPNPVPNPMVGENKRTLDNLV